MNRKPIHWVPTLYLAEGIPYTIVNILSVIFLKLKGLDNDMIALYTGWMNLPWLIKPIWSPVVEMLRTSKFWVVLCQIVMGGALASIGLTIEADSWLTCCITALWLLAFMSATHDIAADGYYIEALSQEQQSAWVGIRSTFYKIAMLLCQGGIVTMAGYLETVYGVDAAWKIAFGGLAVMMAAFGFYHIMAMGNTGRQTQEHQEKRSLGKLIKSYFCKDGIGLMLAFLLLYRLGESQLSKISQLFMLDSVEKGGLGLSTANLGVISGTFGLIAMSVGGILGGLVISRQGLRKWLIPMILALNIPDVFYAIMSAYQIQNLPAITAMVSVEQFGYGFGFAAYSVYMLKMSQGQYNTAHYSISTAFMALGMMLPGMLSGFIQQALGYTGFFVWVLICCVPSVAVAVMAKARMEKQ
ncbi:MAG: MFS transporter [Bacteroidales bacterium]|nr:MFS transporter [Bacteroidales bacterium]